MLKYIFFDLDGTLTDPGLGITNSIFYALEKMGLELPPRESLYRFIGPPLMVSFTQFMGMTEEDAARATKLYREYFAAKGLLENKPYDGIDDLLAELHDKGYILCVATSKPEPFAVQIMEHFDLAKYFTHICGSTLGNERGTKTQVLEYLISKLDDCTSSNTVMIGDRHHDIDGAKNVGLPSIGVLWGYGSAEEFAECGADHVASEMGELAEIIEKL